MSITNQKNTINSYNIQNVKSAYDRVAKDYYTDSHQTCRIFDRIDYEIIKYFEISELISQNDKDFLEIGSGLSKILDLQNLTSSRLLISDLSQKMLNYSVKNCYGKINLLRLSASNIPLKEETFDATFAFLADSYNNLLFFKEAYRVLKPNGVFIETVPSNFWASNYRSYFESSDIAYLRTKDGQTVSIPSITYTKDTYINLLSIAKFRKIIYRDFYLPQDYTFDTIPKSISLVAENLGLEINEIPLISAIKAIK